MSPKVSIIIPCYNQGHFLRETLSNLRGDFQDIIEIIIVNDGSTDENTLVIFNELAGEGFVIINQENKGLSAARNTGILLSQGEYIIPLDADNKLRIEELNVFTGYMDAHDEVDVLYGNANLFGESSGIWKNDPYNMQRLMISNFIDACALIRKSTIVKVGLYDTDMKSGWEDWELWLRMSFSCYKFHYIDKTFFEYRVTKNSMSKTLYSSYATPNSIENYIFQKFSHKMGQAWIINNFVGRFKKNPFLFISKLILRSYFPSIYQKLLKKNKIRNGL